MKKFENIVIVTDLDGTFLGSSDAPIVQRNLDAVKYFTANGGRFTLATGRAPSYIDAVFPDAAKYVNAPAVVCNGAGLYDYSLGELIEIYPLDNGAVIDMAEFVYENFSGAGVRANTRDYEILCTPRDVQNEYIRADLEAYANIPYKCLPLDQWREQVIHKFAVRASAQDVAQMLPMLRQRFSYAIEIAASSPRIIDMQAAGRNKAIMISEGLRRYVGENATIYACGDYFNDLQMLGAADVAVCPSNAHEEVKRMCDLCLCSDVEGLIADLVEHIEKGIG